jgi:pimeloyl-ACP methyl ester carboxylesterase
METTIVVSGDGVALALHRLKGDRSPVLFVPGGFSDHRFWTGTAGSGLARSASEAGFDAYVLDPRGHGRSARPDAGARWVFSDWVEHDVPAAIRASAGKDGRVILIGHSAGGAAALGAVLGDEDLRDRVRALVLIATPAPELARIRRAGAWFIVALSLLLGRFPAKILGFSDQDELPHVMAQWMRWNLAGRWADPGRPDLLDRAGNLAMPVLVVSGSGDRLFSPPEICARLAARLTGAPMTILNCGKATGFSENFGHAGLVLSRNARREVWPRVLAWMKDLA